MLLNNFSGWEGNEDVKRDLLRKTLLAFHALRLIYLFDRGESPTERSRPLLSAVDASRSSVETLSQGLATCRSVEIHPGERSLGGKPFRPHSARTLRMFWYSKCGCSGWNGLSNVFPLQRPFVVVDYRQVELVYLDVLAVKTCKVCPSGRTGQRSESESDVCAGRRFE